MAGSLVEAQHGWGLTWDFALKLYLLTFFSINCHGQINAKWWASWSKTSLCPLWLNAAQFLSTSLLTPPPPSHQTWTICVLVILSMKPFLLYPVEVSVPVAALSVTPDFVNHSLQLKVSVSPLCAALLLPLREKLCANSPEAKWSLTSAFLYHRVCKIVNVIRQARLETIDCHAAQYYVLAPLGSSLCLFPPFISSYMLAIGCFPVGFVELSQENIRLLLDTLCFQDEQWRLKDNA